MTKNYWIEYIQQIKDSLTYIKKELDKYDDNDNIKSDWNTTILNELKAIIQLTSDRL